MILKKWPSESLHVKKCPWVINIMLSHWMCYGNVCTKFQDNPITVETYQSGLKDKQVSRKLQRWIKEVRSQHWKQPCVSWHCNQLFFSWMLKCVTMVTACAMRLSLLWRRWDYYKGHVIYKFIWSQMLMYEKPSDACFKAVWMKVTQVQL